MFCLIHIHVGTWYSLENIYIYFICDILVVHVSIVQISNIRTVRVPVNNTCAPLHMRAGAHVLEI